MEYNRLPKITNTYPQTGNYLTTGINKSSLFGLYPETNKIDFDLESLEDVTIVPNTKLRTLIAVYEDRNDETPQYYTSELYHRDLEASKVSANPYFVNASFNPAYIIDIYLKEIVNSLDAYKAAELKLGLQFARNNFIFFNNAGISGVKKPEINTSQNVNTGIANINRNNQIDSLSTLISKLESEISNVPNKIKRTGFFGARAEIDFDGDTIRSTTPFNRTKQVDDITNQLTDRLNKLKEQKKELEAQKINEGVTKIVSKELKNENIKIDKATFLEKTKDSNIKPSAEKDLIEVNGVFVDCILLVKYIDWVLSEPALDEIEEGGVIAANVLLDFVKVEPEVTKTDTLDSNNNTKETNPTPAYNEGTGKFYEYQIVRLSIPANEDASRMTFKTSTGEVKVIQTAEYGYVGTYCIEENSFNGNQYVYQKTQLAPCNNGGNSGTSGPGGGGGYRGGGSYDYYDNQNRNLQYIDKQQDYANLK